MRYIYHGTNASAAHFAIKDGLHPRGNSSGNWTENAGLFSSHSNWVYLTEDAPLYYAAKSVNDPKESEKIGAVIRLDLDRLDNTLLRPDEDYFYLRKPLKVSDDPEYKKNFVEMCKLEAEQNPGMWQDSLKTCGSLAYAGVIPPSAMVDIRFVDFRFYSVIHGALLQVGEKVSDRSGVLELNSPLMEWLYGRAINKLPQPVIDKIVDLAAENSEVSVEGYRMMNGKIKNLRRRDGLRIHSLTQP